jgi:hypothetical protein
MACTEGYVCGIGSTGTTSDRITLAFADEKQHLARSEQFIGRRRDLEQHEGFTFDYLVTFLSACA